MKEVPKIIFDEKGLKPNSPYQKGQWRKITIHNKEKVCGFFGKYIFLNNFWPAKVFLDDIEYGSVENAYQAAKYSIAKRKDLIICTPKEAVIFSKNNPLSEATLSKWKRKRLKVMKDLLIQKFDKKLNPENHKKLLLTKKKYLEESNYWEDKYWGVHKTDKKDPGSGRNNLGKILMEIRGRLKK